MLERDELAELQSKDGNEKQPRKTRQFASRGESSGEWQLEIVNEKESAARDPGAPRG